jgi:formate dehydrogenase iron-sulfur subunit
MSKAVLVDISRCIGCRACQVACKQWNDMKGVETRFQGDFTNPVKLNAETYTRIKFVEAKEKTAPMWSFLKEQCFHCESPACASGCPVGALQKTPDGPVVYDFKRCVGCRYCMLTCPFGIPKYEWETASNPWIQKCNFCAERIAEGMEPACIKTCPTQVMYFGDRNMVIREAQNRLATNPSKYIQHIYGLKEVGGTSWLYISDVPFQQMGFKTELPSESLPDYTWNVLSSIPAKAAGMVAALGAVAYFRNRGSGEE